MSRPRSRRSIPRQEVAPAAPVRKRSAGAVAPYATELERELAQLRSALQQQKREFEEETANFPQVPARLAHSERTLGQTKTKLIAAEESAVQAASQLSALRARLQEAEAKLQEGADSEREVQRELTSLRDALAAALEREPAFQRVEAELRGEIASLKEALDAANQERDDLLGALGNIERLAQRLVTAAKPSQIPDSDDRRATMRPVATPYTKEAPRSFRRGTPEIIVNGVPLSRASRDR